MTDTIVCSDDDLRRAEVRGHPTLNGIDYVEVGADHRLLTVTFLKPVPADPSDPSRDAWGLWAEPARVSVEGGTRIVGIRVLDVGRRGDGGLEVRVDRGGDYSTYALVIGGVADLDRAFDRIVFSFMAACSVDFDCPHEVACVPATGPEPLLDYMAKDYASFRRLLLDLVPRLNPRFVERNPADLGIALAELLAHAGDHLSYYQDAVANEAFLETLRHRISARRHARLVDYRIGEGRNARAAVHVEVNAPGALARGTRFATRIARPLGSDAAPPGPVLPSGTLTAQSLRDEPALIGARVFETTTAAAFDPRNNEIFIHTWGNEECCVEAGTTEAYFYARVPGTNTVTLPVLRDGDYLVLEEVRGARTGLRADATPGQRAVVRIEGDPLPTEDPLYQNTLRAVPSTDPANPVQWVLEAWPASSAPTSGLPLLHVRWRRADALDLPLCLSSRTGDGARLVNVTVARGNVVIVDHGLTVGETLEPPGTRSDDGWCNSATALALREAPLTMIAASDGPASVDPESDPNPALPAVALRVRRGGGAEELWQPVPDLLSSTPLDRHFVAEVDDEGYGHLRFGDGEYGMALGSARQIDASYRVGNGRDGNVGAESLAHAEVSGGAGWIAAIRNPLPATGGSDPESIEHLRVSAPKAFHSRQLRAISTEDYAAATRTVPGVQGAVASFRWTGSWYTVFIGVDPVARADLETDATGRQRLRAHLETLVRRELARRRLAGYDLELRAPRFIPLELELDVCVDARAFRADVVLAVREAFSAAALADGRKGYFHPDNFSFGDPVYLSRVYAAVERVPGVESVVVRTFRRYGQSGRDELERGVIALDGWEVAQLENDPNYMERGVLRVYARGGKG